MADFVAQDIEEVDGVADGTAHTEHHIALFDGEVDHQDGFAIVCSAEVFGEGVDFVHKLDGVVVIVKQREIKAEDMLGTTRFGCGGCWCRFGCRHGGPAG